MMVVLSDTVVYPCAMMTNISIRLYYSNLATQILHIEQCLDLAGLL